MGAIAQLTPDEVADLISRVAAANALMRRELSPITDGGLAVSQTVLDRLAAVIAQTRPAAAARAALSALPATALLDGVAVWRSREGSASR